MEFWIRLTDQLRSFNDYVEVHQKRENGVVLGEYKMALSDIISSLSNAATDGVKHETPILPKNCIKLVSRATGYEVFIDLPKRKWQIEYEKKAYLVGFPRLILNYSIVDRNIRNLKIVAVKDKGPINKETTLYRFPYSNVHHTTGDVCMGGNQFPEIECLSQLEKTHFLFFGTPFGNDYGAMTIEGKPLKVLFDEFSNIDFDDELLIPLDSTFGEFFHF